MKRSNDPLSNLPDLEALLHDPKRFKNRLIWSMVLAPPVSMQRAGQPVSRPPEEPEPASGNAPKEEPGE